MMLRSSINNTRRFFQKTIDNFKAFFSNGYQKLPKSPNNISINKPCSDLTFYISHNNNNNNKNNNRTHNPNIMSPSPSPSPLSSSSSLHEKLHATPRTAATPQKQRRREHEETTLCSKPKIQLVRQKLQDLETVIGVMSDTDHVSDVQEFLHYYSRLRCPAYIDIVEQFFMDMYSEFLVPQLEPPKPTVDLRRRKTVLRSNRH